MDNQFKFLANAYLKKGGSPKEGVKVGGIITTEDSDVDGESVIPIDWSYFDNGFGKIKYEHDVIKGPDAIIGYPLKRVKKGNETHFEGELIPFDPDVPDDKLTPQQRLAKSTYTLLKHIDEYNARNPKVPQRAGWSIEGNYVKHKSLKPGQVGARITNVVFTTEPRNIKTLATLVKSLNAGDAYAMSPDTQTGWAALRKESIDGVKERESINNKKSNKKGEKKMFKKKIDVYNEHKTAGLSHEDALKKANEWEEEQNTARTNDYNAVEKSLSSSKEKLQKSLNFANEVGEVALSEELDTRPLRKSFEREIKKSLRVDESGAVDPTEFLEDLQTRQFDIMDGLVALDNKINKLAKSLAASAEANTDLIEAQDFLRKSSAVNNDAIQTLTNDLAVFAGILKKSLGNRTLSTDGIKTEDFNKKIEDDEDEQYEKLTKSQVVQVLDHLVEKEMVQPKELMAFESTGQFIDENTEKLVKSNYSKVLNL